MQSGCYSETLLLEQEVEQSHEFKCGIRASTCPHASVSTDAVHLMSRCRISTSVLRGDRSKICFKPLISSDISRVQAERGPRPVRDLQ